MFLQTPPSDRAIELSLDSRSAPVDEEGCTTRGAVFMFAFTLLRGAVPQNATVSSLLN